MAEKEATVYIVDVGRSMGERRHGRSVTDLEWAMQYVWDKITRTVGHGRKTALASVIALRTDETSNDLQHDDSFSNISVVFGLQQVLMPDIRKIQEAIKPSRTYHGDVISSLVLAISMISTQCKKLKYRREIKLVTNATGLINGEDLDQIREKLNEDGIDLTIIGADFDDPEYGFKEEDKDERKAKNEKLLRDFAESCNSARVATLDEAVSQLETPTVKDVKTMVSFKGYLTLGDPNEYESAVRIPVERYYRTSIAKPPSASSFVQRTGEEPGQDGPSGGESDSLVTIRTSRTYQIDDESAPGGKTDVERDDLARGYEYGRTAVHISQTDENITTLTTFAGLEVLGFIPSEKFDRYLPMSTTHVIIASRGDQKAGLALSSFIHALFEGESYVVARMVTKESKPPTVVLLAPYFEASFEALMEVQLPFSEDLRSYRFPPLDKVVTLSGKIITEHRNLPNEKLQDAMDQYVDSMELDFKDENGNSTSGLPIDEFYSPVLHRIESAIRWRAVHPKDPVPAPPPALTQFSQPDEDLLNESKKQLENLIAAAEVKKVPPKVKGRKRNRETEKPLSGLDVDALLNQEPKRAKISPDNAIPEFKQLLSRADNADIIFDAAKQMSTIIENQIKHSLGDSSYERVVEGLGTMREELHDFEEPGVFNDFFRGLKKKILDEELGGDRKELWWLIRKTQLGLLTHKETERSEVSEEEAAEFLAAS